MRTWLGRLTLATDVPCLTYRVEQWDCRGSARLVGLSYHSKENIYALAFGRDFAGGVSDDRAARRERPITLPKEYREAFALEGGAPISVLQLGNGLVLVPEQARFRQLCERVARAFASHGIEVRDILQTLPATRERVFARHYPDLAAQKPTRKRPTRK